MNPLLREVAQFLRIKDPESYGSDDRLMSAIRRRADSMEATIEKKDEELAKKDNFLEEMRQAQTDTEGAPKTDTDGPERVDEEQRYDELKTQFDELKAKYDTLMAEHSDMLEQKRVDEMKPMADEYEIEVSPSDRTDDLYRKIAAKLVPTFRADAKDVPMDFVRGVVEGDWMRRKADQGARFDSAAPTPTPKEVVAELDRQAGVRAGEAMWRSFAGQGTPAPLPGRSRTDAADDLFRPGPSAHWDRLYSSPAQA